MAGIDIYDFRDLFASIRSMAIVGNSQSILNWDNGELIDSYDMVVRFNQARTQGLEQKVGSRTDVLVANEANSVRKSPPPGDVLNAHCVVCFTRPNQDVDIEAWREWAGDLPTLITLAPDIVGVDAGARSRVLTQGTYALYTFLRLFRIEHLFVTGFTMYGAVPGGASNIYAPDRKQVGTWHDLDQEAKIFSSILAAFAGELKASEEVLALLQRFGHAPAGSRAAAGNAIKTGPTLYEYTMGRLAWNLMKWGIKLRRSLEANSRIDFDSLKK